MPGAAWSGRTWPAGSLVQLETNVRCWHIGSFRCDAKVGCYRGIADSGELRPADLWVHGLIRQMIDGSWFLRNFRLHPKRNSNEFEIDHADCGNCLPRTIGPLRNRFGRLKKRPDQWTGEGSCRLRAAAENCEGDAQASATVWQTSSNSGITKDGIRKARGRPRNRRYWRG